MASDDNGDILSLFGIEEDPPKKPPKPGIEFVTTRRVVGGEDESHGQIRAVLVYGGMVLEIPKDAFLAWLQGMKGNGWSGLRRDEHQDIVGGMEEIRRRMGLSAREASKHVGLRNPKKNDPDFDVDDLLNDL